MADQLPELSALVLIIILHTQCPCYTHSAPVTHIVPYTCAHTVPLMHDYVMECKYLLSCANINFKSYKHEIIRTTQPQFNYHIAAINIVFIAF